MKKSIKIISFVIGGLLFSGVAYGVTTQTFVNPIPDANISSADTWNTKITTSSLSSTATGITYTSDTGVFSWTAGYEGLRTSSSTDWNAKQDTITAGRSLTISNNTIDADAELYTTDGGFDWATATTTYNPVHQRRFTSSSTLTYFECRTDGATIVIGADERASSTPQTAGTDIFTGGSFTCSGTKNSTTTFANSNISALNYMSFDIDSNSSSTAKLNVNFTYLK